MASTQSVPPQGASARFLARAARAVFAPYPKALLGSARGVHELRVAARRMRVALALLACKPGSKRRRRADRILREIARAVSVPRDIDVSAELLDRFAPRFERDRQAMTGFKRALAGARARGQRRSKERLLDLDLAALRAYLREIVALDAIDIEALRARMGERVEVDGAELLERVRLAGRRFRPDALHAVRRQVRRLRYAAEIADELLERESGSPGLWKSLQSLIGEIHDRHVLALWLGEREARASRAGDAIASRTARTIRSRVLRDARRLHRDLLEADPAGLARDALRAMRADEVAAQEGAAVLEFPIAAQRFNRSPGSRSGA